MDDIPTLDKATMQYLGRFQLQQSPSIAQCGPIAKFQTIMANMIFNGENGK